MKLKSWLSSILVIYLTLVQVHAAKADVLDNSGYVKFGAFLLSEEPNNASKKHERVGYLPIGTVVKYDGQIKSIFNHSVDVQNYEDYIYVHSNTGYSGYLKTSLVTPFEDDEVILPLRYGLIVRDVDSNEKILNVNRAKSMTTSFPLKLLSKSGDKFIVEFEHEGEVRTGYVYEHMVDGYRFIRLSHAEINNIPVIESGSPEQFVAESLATLSEHVAGKGGETAEKIVSFFSKMNMLQCRVSSDADAELSGKIFGNGLGMKINFVIAKQDSIYSISTLKITNNSKKSTDFYQFNSVKCLNGTPDRLENFVLLSKSFDTGHFILSKAQLPKKIQEQWSRFEIERSNKMLVIDGYPTYQAFIEHIEDSKMLSDLPHSEKMLLANSIIKQVAHFKTPK